MSTFNVWVSMSGEFKSELWPFVRSATPAVTFPDINNLSEPTVVFFRNIVDEGAYQRLFKEWSAAGRTYRVWSFYAVKPDDHQQVMDDIDMLVASYPQDFGVLGAWRWDDGGEVQQQGSTLYPIPNQTINFMPDVVIDATDPENPIYGPATELTDVILVLGQAKRSFASYAGSASTGGCNG